MLALVTAFLSTRSPAVYVREPALCHTDVLCLHERASSDLWSSIYHTSDWSCHTRDHTSILRELVLNRRGPFSVVIVFLNPSVEDCKPWEGSSHGTARSL